jgi:hypothetical protein
MPVPHLTADHLFTSLVRLVKASGILSALTNSTIGYSECDFGIMSTPFSKNSVHQDVQFQFTGLLPRKDHRGLDRRIDIRKLCKQVTTDLPRKSKSTVTPQAMKEATPNSAPRVSQQHYRSAKVL